MQKARRRPIGAPTACRRTVSGSLSLPCSGCFPPFPHGTGPLSVFREYLALRVGPRCFGQDSSCPALLRWPPCHDSSPVRGYHPLRPAFPGRSGSSPCALGGSYYPAPASTGTVWAPASSLAATGAIDVFFLLLRVLRRTDRYLLAVPRAFSQLAASFLASGSLGILRPPLFASLK